MRTYITDGMSRCVIYVTLLCVFAAALPVMCGTLTDKKIALDPGHGGYQPGAVGWDGAGYPNEEHFNLDVGLMLRTQLWNAGATVVMTRTSDTYVSLTARVNYINSENPDIFISIHCNSYHDSSAHGTETFWHTYGTTDDQRLAGCVQSRLVEKLGTTDRGVKQAAFTVLTVKTSIPAVLAEMLFISNQQEFNLINSAVGKDKCVDAFRLAVFDFFGSTPTLPPTVETRDATNVSETAANINGRIVDDGGANIDERRFSWGTTSSCSDGWTANVSVSGNYFSYYLTGLNSNTTYYFQTWAHNSAGWGSGSSKTFNTLSPCSACTPSGPNPSSGSTNVSVNHNLLWSCSGGNGWDSFDVHFGTSSSPPLVRSNYTSTSYNLGTLNYNTTYYWKIVAKKSGCDSVTGSVWHFRTESQPCSACTPGSPNPSSGSTNVSVNHDLLWSCSGGDGWDNFDIYFGTSSNPPLVNSNHTSTSYSPGTLQCETRYYWKVVANKSGCDSATGPIWDFTTEACQRCQACTPQNPNPSDGALNVSVNH
ncbi:MAG: N-acetylmuramoyl-L-alanine amidase, partial [Candidatus Latescibacteria bacterium]|nr:N-acetylmuramoyl-L-alanine amidase [Candidatus Latescibacterota bacterium]